MDLRQRLNLLHKLQRDIQSRSAAPPGQPAPAVPAAKPVTRPAPPALPSSGRLPDGVREHATTHGPVWWREQFYPADHCYGNQTLAAFAHIPPSVLALIAQDERLADVNPENLVLLDTETTGLSGGTGTVPFLIGTGQWRDGGLLIRQYFLPDYGYEQPMLAHLADTLAEVAGLVSFNGKTFDQPLLATRFIMQRQRLPLIGQPHVDLLHPSRRLWRRRLGDCRLGTLERHVLGYERDGDVPGALIPALYADYVQSQRPELLVGVIQHNELDLLALAGLAVHVASALSGADRLALHPLDELGRAQWLEDLGQPAAAIDAYRKALASDLPGPARRDALWRLAAAQRRLGDYAAAAATWAELVACGHSVAALVELAKYHEHRSGDLAEALRLTEEALQLALGQRWFGHAPRSGGARTQTDIAALRHRQARLQRKLARRSAPERPPVETACADERS